MPHLAEDPAVGGGDALDGTHRIVGVEGDVVGGLAVEIHVLRGDLAVFRKRRHHFVACQEAAFAVGDGHGVDLAHLGLRKPRRAVGGDARAHQPRLVAADGVEGQGGGFFIRLGDPAVGHQAQLDERLEAVADAGHEAVALLQERLHRFLHRLAPEEGRDELARAVGLVAGGEAAGEEDHLALADEAGEVLHGLGDVRSRAVLHHEDLRLGTGVLHGAGGVVLAVGAGEDGDEHLGLGAEDMGRKTLGGRRREGLGDVPALLGVGGIDRLELAEILGKKRLHGDRLAAEGEDGLFRYLAQEDARLDVAAHLQNKGAKVGREEVGKGQASFVNKAQAVAHGHFEDGLGHAACGGRVGRSHLAALHQGFHRVIEGFEALGIGQAVLEVGRPQPADRVPRFLQLGTDNLPGFAGGHREGHQGGRHVQVLEGAGHGVLAADGRHAQIHLGGEGAKQGRRGLSPALGIAAGLFKVLLEGEVDVFKGRAGGDELAHRLHHRRVGAVVGALGGEIGVVAPGHEGAAVGVAVLQGDLVHHGLDGRALELSAEGHEHRARADGGVKPLGKTLAGAEAKVARLGFHAAFKAFGHGSGGHMGGGHGDGHVLFRAVGV